MNQQDWNSDTQYWLIYFEDSDIAPEVFTEEYAARMAFQDRKLTWNCHIFMEVG